MTPESLRVLDIETEHSEEEIREQLAEIYKTPQEAVRDIVAAAKQVEWCDEDTDLEYVLLDDVMTMIGDSEDYGRAKYLFQYPLHMVLEYYYASLKALGAVMTDEFERIINQTDNPRARPYLYKVVAGLGEVGAPLHHLLVAEVVNRGDREKRELARISAATALGKTGPANDEVVASLVKVAESHEEWQPLRTVCIEALMDLGPDAKAAVPALQRIREDETAGKDLHMFAWAALKSVTADSKWHSSGVTVADHMRSLYGTDMSDADEKPGLSSTPPEPPAS